jgi:cell division septal protein FtsQ
VCKKVMKENIQTLNIEGKNDTNLNNIVEVFNKRIQFIYKLRKIVKMSKQNQLTK